MTVYDVTKAIVKLLNDNNMYIRPYEGELTGCAVGLKCEGPYATELWIPEENVSSVDWQTRKLTVNDVKMRVCTANGYAFDEVQE